MVAQTLVAPQFGVTFLLARGSRAEPNLFCLLSPVLQAPLLFHVNLYKECKIIVKKIIVITVCLIGLALVAVTASAGKLASNEFVKVWATTFKKCPTLKAVKSLPNANVIYIRTFNNGEWVAVSMEHACCSGAGFNATVFYDSQHKIYSDTTYSFCGLEGLASELGEIKATSLKTFYPNLKKLSLHQVE